ncbi:MAG: Crp/Fnr family transcriptional regulator, partial [Bacteroidales bacterium]|nr:Crp/Fnr family transcriptional regulator [Bacteroidales bacterium]
VKYLKYQQLTLIQQTLIMYDFSALIKQLQRQTPNLPSEELLLEFLNSGQMKIYGPNEAIIEAGDINRSVYLIVEGLYRLGWEDGEREVTYGFGSIGTMFLSPKGFVSNEESCWFMRACTEIRLLKWNYDQFMEWILRSHEICLWAFLMAIHQLYCSEIKTDVIKGSARQRLEALSEKESRSRLHTFGKYPELLQHISSQTLATYLGIAPSYLSTLRKSMMEEEKEGK